MADVLILDFVDKRILIKSPDGSVRSVTEPLALTGVGVPPSRRSDDD
jgi:hypothetical protein